MLDSEHSTVTYTSISSDYEEPSCVGSPGFVVYGYDRLPMHPPSPDYVLGPKHPPSPNYVPGPKHPPLPVYVPYVPEPAYLEFMPPEDDVFPTKEQPLPAAVSPTANSPADYPTDSDDDKEEESSGDNADDEEDDEGEDEEEEEEHLASDNSAEVDRLLAIPTSPSSPLTSLSSPLPRIPSPPFLVSPPLPISPPPLPISPTHPLGFRAAMIRAAVLSTYILAPRSETPPSGTPPLLPIPLPTSSPPLLLPFTNCRADFPEVTLPPRKRLCIAPSPRYEIRECSFSPTARPTGGFRADYGFVGTLDAEIRRDLDREDTYEVYRRLDDAQDDKSLMSGQLNLLRKDRHSHACMARLMKSEARASHKAWVQPMEANDMTHSEKMTPKKRTIRASPATTTTTTPVTNAQFKALIDQSIANALATRDTDKSQNVDDSHNSEIGTEGVVSLTQWFERMETIFNISNYAVENQVKFASCALHGVALTWWKSHVKIIGQDAAHNMPWNTLMKMMTAKYCP
ncbi:hypothetical protein Tco_1525963 [Tanacetum coccineum]